MSLSLQSLSKTEAEYSSTRVLTFAMNDRVQPLDGERDPVKESNGKNAATTDAADQPRTPLAIVKNFCNITTAHGWRRVANSSHLNVRFIWLALTSCALVINILHVTLLVGQYLDFPYEQVAQVELSELPFPSITLCNMQPISQTTTAAFVQNETTKVFRWDNITKFFFSSDELGDYDDGGVLSKELLYNRVRQPTGFFENIDDESMLIGHQPMDFLLSCTFGLTRCDFDNFTYYQSPDFFNCYTFNGGNTSRERLIVKSTGPSAGLSLIMYLESDNGDFLYNGTYYTFGNILNAAGVRVVIHPPDTRPSPQDLGFDIPPGFSSSIGVRALRHQRLGSPYGSCRPAKDWELGGGRYIYSSHSCLKQCQQQHVMDSCACISAELPIPAEASARGLNFCGRFNPDYQQTFYDNLSCEINVTLAFMSSQTTQKQCGCLPPCEEYEYETKTSYSFWPLDFTQLQFFDIYVNNHPRADELKAYKNLGRFNITEIIYRGLIRKNFVRLNVYLESLVLLEYVEKESYTFSNLWSDIGGTFGLWIGMSILTWCEVIELIMGLIFNAFKKK
ncbi:hypothetical protein LSH36_103g02009 [Paralvinella palmiformis]|uniref:Uncharacterized protein n=1 Tax=Paralvinella palmiformis TaxID=53620 RepID=A0AAD9K061_9ANNE|nr:hypothetical protein LSH36_103g02009 [Paralvinella palmiformis]